MEMLKRFGFGIFALALLFPATVSAQWASVGLERARNAELPDAPVTAIIATTMNWLLAILGFIAIIAFVISGILYLTAAGDDGQIETAKTAMKYAIIGVVVALMGFVIIQAIDLWLRGSRIF